MGCGAKWTSGGVTPTPHLRPKPQAPLCLWLRHQNGSAKVNKSAKRVDAPMGHAVHYSTAGSFAGEKP